MEKVLLTGVTGFIGLHCCKQLLDQGYAVRGTLRDKIRKEEVITAMKESNTSVENLEIIELDLLNDEGWEEAGKDCDYVMHVASPISASDSIDEEVLIRPAVDGTLRLLNAAKVNKAKKVILTSSVASIFYDDSKKKITMKMIGQMLIQIKLLHTQRVKLWRRSLPGNSLIT